MKKKTRILVIVGSVVLSLVAICAFGIYKYGPQFGVFLTPPTPSQYGEYALQLMEYGIYAGTPEWKEAKSAAAKEFKSAKTYEDTYKTLASLAKLAGGKHSFFKEPQKADTTLAGAVKEKKDTLPAAVAKKEISLPTVEIQDGIHIIKLPTFSRNPNEATRYSEIVIKALSENRTPKGVIVDLRGNNGGDMNPMIIAVSPLIPDGVVISFGMKLAKTDVTLEGLSLSSSNIEVNFEPFKIPETTPIAILTDDQTASSAEATLLCFRGLPNVKVFGAPTSGFASGNNPFDLYDGATLVLTIGTDIARTGEVFCEDPIAPDFETETPQEDAVKWIEESAVLQ